MARLDALPSIAIIHGFRGILDFYLWKGLPCVRKWPVTPPSHRTPAMRAASALFGRISTDYRTLAPLALEAFQEAAKDQPRTARDLYICAAFGHLHERTEAPPPPPEEQMYDAYVCLRDVKAPGVMGGDFNSGAWRTRDLNDEQADPEDICALAANQFVLAAGTYRAAISCPANRVVEHAARLWNVTASAALLLGTSGYAHATYRGYTRSFIVGRFTVPAGQALEVQHRCSTTKAGNGFGLPTTYQDEIYTILELWREAP